MKTIKTDNRDIESIQRIFLENREDTAFVFESGVFLKEAECTQAPLILSNTDYTPFKNIALHLDGMKKITLDFKGQTLECSGRLQPLTLTACSDIAVKNLVIDWTMPLSAEGEVISASPDHIDLLIDKDKFPFTVENDWLYFFDGYRKAPLWKGSHIAFYKNTRTVVRNSGDIIWLHSAAYTAEGAVRFLGNFKQVYDPGTIIVLRHSEREHAGIFAENCKNLSFENITIHATGGLGILCQFNENLRFSNVSFTANRKGGRKVVCGHDDGLHLANNKGEIIVEDCLFDGLMDDPINVHGLCARIEEVLDSKTVKGRFVHHQAQGFALFARPGETMSFIEHLRMNSIACGEVEEFSLEPGSREFFILKFSTEIPDSLKAGDALENITNTPSVVFRNNFFGSCRARGILLSTPKPVLVENNIFESSGSAILIAGDANGWYESGACRDVRIRNNIFLGECNTSEYQFCEGIISIYPEIPEPDKEYPFHSNITITNNKFFPAAYPVLFALSAENLTFMNNTIYLTNKFDQESLKDNAMVVLKYCKNVAIQTGEEA
ncbi:MAG: right-handed parallel beta-helix repeat-containing protein [Treponema sp.]|jgi:hypothetical protein|nr:right-handed parallel beta-helix repeat-containing protein [Treponema sp.]